MTMETINSRDADLNGAEFDSGEPQYCHRG